MTNFLIDRAYRDYLSAMGFCVEQVLKKAGLPEDLFARQSPCLGAEEYFRFLQAIEALSPDKDAPVRLASSGLVSQISPPVFAASCSPDARTCLRRLAQYKPLIGALLYRVEETETELSVELVSARAGLELPEILVGIEFVFLVGLIRKATQEPVTPLSAAARQPVKNPAYAEFLGVPITQGGQDRLVFSRADALLPFISCNASMWEFFVPELDRRLAMLGPEDSYAARVHSALLELLPSGMCAIDDVAARLGYSSRSLQRKLQAEHTSFQQQLRCTRRQLAEHYLRRTDLRAEDIAYLLGYQDTSSFQRAFSAWTGASVSKSRQPGS